MKLLIHSQTLTVQSLKFVNAFVISSHTLLVMWLHIHAGYVKANPCRWKGVLVPIILTEITKTIGIMTYESNYIHVKQWDVIMFSWTAVDIRAWMSNSVSYKNIDVITYPSPKISYSVLAPEKQIPIKISVWLPDKSLRQIRFFI